MLFIIQLTLSLGGTALYFYQTGLTRIKDIENYNKSYSITLAEAFADVAELSYGKKNYKKLKKLFREKIQDTTIDEAFFVLKNGKIIVHSDKEVEKSLRGNIANDEFSYNIDLILWPVKKKSKEVMFTPYNIMGKRPPFTREQRMYIKKYYYKEIETLGWLVTRAVYYRNKPIGTVNFLIYNDKINQFLEKHASQAMFTFFCAVAGSFVLSLIISLIVLIRYRSIQKNMIAATGVDTAPQFAPDKGPAKRKEKKPVVSRGNDYITIELSEDMNIVRETPEFRSPSVPEPGPDSEHKESPVTQKISVPHTYEEESVIDMGREVRDAIPVAKKR